MYGLVASNLLEATIITSDGQIVIASECQNPDLFYALRGGGYGFGIVASMTVRTHQLPELFVSTGDSYIDAVNDAAFEELLAEFLNFYRTNLIGPKWADQIRISANSSEHYPLNGWKMDLRMTGTNLTYEDAQMAWKPLELWLAERPDAYAWDIHIDAFVGKDYWTRKNPDTTASVYNPREPERAFFWTGEEREVSEYWLFALNSRYLRTDQFLEDPDVGAKKLMNFFKGLPELPKSIPIAIHLNKAQYGASQWAVDELVNMPVHPSVKGSFGLILVSFGVENYHPRVPDRYQYNTSDIKDIQILCNTTILENCESSQDFIDAMNNFRYETPGAGSYFNQADFFEPDFQDNFWGHEIYAKLLDIKMTWDPNGLFYCHNCVGSEQWEEGGMCRR